MRRISSETAHTRLFNKMRMPAHIQAGKGDNSGEINIDGTDTAFVTD